MSETDIIANFKDLTLEDVGIVPVFTHNSSKTGGDMAHKEQSEILKLIENIGYTGSLLSENELNDALKGGPKSVEYTNLVNFLTTELGELCGLDECVNSILVPEDSITFLMELSSFLKELGCPYNQLMSGHVSERLNTIEDRILLLKHLIFELIAARILQKNQPEKRINLKLSESSQASDLRKILQILGYPQPPANITMQTLIQKITPTIQKLVQRAPEGLVGNPMFNWTLSEKQWETLDKIDHDLNEEYLIRREMLLKRLDCTVQSFQWSDRTKGKDALFEKVYSEKRKRLKVEPEVNLADLLAARDDLAIIEKTSSALVRKNTKSSINRVIIGEVPDRGGRTSEQQPPPPEMPPWQQRNSGFGGGQSNRGGGQTNRGGSNFSRGGGGNNYGENRGGGGRGRGGNSYGNRDESQRGSEYSTSGGNNYSGGNRGDSQRQSNYSYGGDTYSGGNNYSGGFKGDSQRRSDYSTGGDNYSGGNNYSGSRCNYSRGESNSAGYNRTDSYSQSSLGYSDSTSGYSQSRGGFDSAGSYGGYSQDYQEPKRAKTYDQFQQNRNTYADQYVQESQHNMQYQSRDRDNQNRSNRGGRSNYNRGGGSYR